MIQMLKPITLLSAVVHEVLGEDNYEDWSAQLKTYLMAHDLWDIIEQTTEPNTQEDDGVIALEACNNKNLIALDAIKNSCGPDTFSQIREITSAKIAWDTLAEKYSAGTNHIYLMYRNLCKALRSGNWTAAKELLPRPPNAVGAIITHKGETALHIAVDGGHFRVVDELVKLMPEQNLETLDWAGLSALSRAALDGKKEMAQCMLRKNEKLINIRSPIGYLPVCMAISFGHIETARYLYSLTPPEDLMPESGYNGASLFIDAISTGTLDIALDLLQRCPRLIFANSEYGNYPLMALASTPHLFPSGSRLVFWKRWIYKYCIHIQLADSIINETRLNIQKVEKHQRDQVNTIISVRTLPRYLLSNVLNFLGIEQLYEMKSIHVQSHKLLCQMCKVISNSNEQGTDMPVCDAIVCAIKSGIIEFVSEMLKENPGLVWAKGESERGIFSIAVLHRQAKILSLLLEFHLKNAVTCCFDVNYNGMLHMAGMSAESTMLNCIPGAALQMQKELQWFKEVETIVHHKVREHKNEDGLTPRELFTQQHEAMLKAGEQWMKNTATSCTVVGALIITIMFAVAFTIPGGNKQDTGLPLFLQEDLFIIFIISDALSLFSSSTSVMIFLGILTSRYAEDDFLRSLPTKMIIGLSTLFFSIATMMIAFSAALLIMLRGHSWIVEPIICLAGVPVALFVMMQFRLLVEMFISTYGPGILDRKIKLTFN
ncbi:uncharacterized protein LOC122291609 [Carya illinoinensis]|uniref:uncharacterized protein LOC122291609 n=1 Tax=Carya illinoinensis TaxID=32201 RepID=UPI001C71AE88|nr:uncharacterized protein LOC122291609 [Carya illinoinensis]